MTGQGDPQVPGQPEPPTRPGVSARTVTVLIVLAVFAGVIAAKYLPSVRADGNGGQASQVSVTSVRNDAVADYQAAVGTGKPIYVLFHSLS